MSTEPQRTSGEREIDEALYQSLTPTERACLRLAASGKQAKEIGPELGLTYRSVQQYVYAGSRKLEMRGGARAGAALLAYEARRQVELLQPNTTETEPLDRSPVIMAYEVPGDLPLRSPDQSADQEVREPSHAFGSTLQVGIKAASKGRELDFDVWRRLLVILAWFVGAPAVLAIIVVAYLGITLVERALTTP